MLPRTGWILGLGLMVMLSLGVFSAWGETEGETESGLVWVEEHGHGDAAEVVKLSDLADGETRTFDTEKGQIVASRDGDDILLTLRKEGEEEHSFTCVANKDECLIITPKDGSDKSTVLVIKKRAHGAGGEEMDIDMMVLGDHHAMARGKALFIGGDGANVLRLHTGHKGMKVRIEESGVVLRCPEGDTTMRVEEDEADKTFFCPKHNVPLEKAERQMTQEIHTVVVVEEDEGHEDDED